MIVGKLLELFEYLSDLEVDYALDEGVENFEPFGIHFLAEEILGIDFQGAKPNKESLKARGIVWDEYHGCHIYVI